MLPLLPVSNPVSTANADALVDIRGASFRYGTRTILDNLSLTIPRGKITAIMGGSGCGKTSLLNLIGGRLRPSSGQVRVDGINVPDLDKHALYQLRKRMGMLFQHGALLTDLSVFENVAFPLREHTKLPESLLRHVVLMKLETVGLRGARDSCRGNCPVAWRGAWRWRAPSCSSPCSCCTTNRSPVSIRFPWVSSPN